MLGQVESWQNKNETLKKLLGKCKWQRKGKNSKKKGKIDGEKEEKEEEENVGSRIR